MRIFRLKTFNLWSGSMSESIPLGRVCLGTKLSEWIPVWLVEKRPLWAMHVFPKKRSAPLRPRSCMNTQPTPDAVTSWLEGARECDSMVQRNRVEHKYEIWLRERLPRKLRQSYLNIYVLMSPCVVTPMNHVALPSLIKQCKQRFTRC